MPTFKRIWLGRLDSNQGMAVPKTAALPLGYARTMQENHERFCILRQTLANAVSRTQV